mgnify:CR=1 FL=1
MSELVRRYPCDAPLDGDARQMAQPNRAVLIECAADLFARVQADPENSEVLAERDAFLALGDAQAHAYATVTKAWVGAGQKQKSNTPKVLLGLALLAGFGVFAAEPLRIALLADIASGALPESVALASGDIALVDAGTALIDRSVQTTREIELLKGAAVFDVDVTGQAFRVIAGDVTVEVLGTTFETALNGDITTVSVEEGSVQVFYNEEKWQLSPGNRLRIPADGQASLQEIPLPQIAAWRSGTVNIEGRTFGEVASMLERRLPGAVQVPSGALRQTPMSGAIDLGDPETALRTLAAASNAQLISLRPLSWLILRN